MSILYPGDLTPDEEDAFMAANGFRPESLPRGWQVFTERWGDGEDAIEAEYRVVSEESEGPAPPDDLILGIDAALPDGYVVLVRRHPDGTMTVIQDEKL